MNVTLFHLWRETKLLSTDSSTHALVFLNHPAELGVIEIHYQHVWIDHVYIQMFCFILFITMNIVL